MRASSLFVLLSLAGLCSCGAEKGVITKRYAKFRAVKDDKVIKDSILVGAYILEPAKETPPKATTIVDLSPKGQAALIGELSRKETPTAESLLQAAGSKLAPKPSDTKEVVTDYSKITKQVVISVLNQGHNPANRIAKIKVTLDLTDADSSIKLISCDKLTTTFATLDLGKLNYSDVKSSEISGNATLGAGIETTTVKDDTTTKATGSNGASIGGKLTSTKTFSEEVLLKQRLVTLNASIEEKKLTLYQEGTIGIDMTGNIVANITFEVKDAATKKVYSFADLKAKDNTFNVPKLIKVNESYVIYANLTKGITAKVSYDADYRTVTKYGETLSESDDEVSLYYGTEASTNTIELVPKDKLMPKLYVLSPSNDTNNFPVQLQLVSAAAAGDLIFASPEDAENFLKWLRAKYVVNPDRSLKISNDEYLVQMPSTFTNVGELRIVPYGR